MYRQEISLEPHDADTTFFLAMHHLELAAALFERFRPEEFAAARERAIAPPDAVKAMLASVVSEMELEAWLSEAKTSAAREMLHLADDDPLIDPIWERHADVIRTRLSAAGRTEDEVRDELGDMASVLHEMREGDD